tara:strand:+ start:255 stop:1295 length:1041 start_codon:yes stop_codon:yes gene_type:complete
MIESEFYGTISSGASFNKKEGNFFLEENINSVKKEIFNNCKRMNLDQSDLQGKIIMNVGSGREALGLMQFNPKKIYHYDVSHANIEAFRKILVAKNLEEYIVSKQLDLSADKLPSSTFDFIYLHGIIQHVSDVSKAMQNLTNSLRENGFMWFYFYRPGSLAVFLGSLQRFLLKETDINFFREFLKNNCSYEFADGILDDCFVPNRQLFYPRDYIKFLENNSIQIYGDSFLVNKKKNYDFEKFHQSVIFFTKKEGKDKLKGGLCNSLDPINEIDVLDPIHYKGEHEILEIIRLIQTKDLTQSYGINNLVLEIEKVKLDFAKNIFKNRFVEKKYVNSSLNKIILYLNA